MDREVSHFGDCRVDEAGRFLHDRLVRRGPRGISVRSVGGSRAGEVRIGRFLRTGKVTSTRCSPACPRAWTSWSGPRRTASSPTAGASSSTAWKAGRRRSMRWTCRPGPSPYSSSRRANSTRPRGSSPLDHPALPQALDDRAAVPHRQDQRVRHRGRLQGDRLVPGPLRHDARRRRLLPATRPGQGRREQPPARADGPATTESQGP